VSTAETTRTLGRRVYGLGVLTIGVLCLAWGNFDPGQPVPMAIPGRSALAYIVAAFLMVAGAAVEGRRTAAAWAAAALTVYYALIVVIWMNGRVVLAHYTEFGSYSGSAEQLAIAAAALIIYAASANIDRARAARLTRLGQVAFAVCAILFGGAHFLYMNLTAPLVPHWLPPSREFWGYATGVGHIAAGVSILVGMRARLGAILLTAMYLSFILLVWGPMVLGDPSSHDNWTEGALTLALTGCAWVVADSLPGPGVMIRL
jgi:uncharacterized membrane protein